MNALVRLRSGRCFYADPPQGPTGGRPRRHGTKLVCDDPTTWPPPTSEWRTTDVNYGRVLVQCWSGLHAIPHNHAKRGTRQARPIVRGTLIRLEVERLPKPDLCPRCRSGSGGGDRNSLTWRPFGESMLPGSPLNTPIASSNRFSSGRRPGFVPPRPPIAGPG